MRTFEECRLCACILVKDVRPVFADTSIILRPVGLGEPSDAMVGLCFVGPLTYIPKTSDIIIEFHHKIEENYFKRRTYRRCVASRRMKEWWLVHSDREYDTLYS